MRELSHLTNKEYLHDAQNGAWKGLLKGIAIGLAVGVGMYLAGVGLAAISIPVISTYLQVNMPVFAAFSANALLGFAAFNGLFFGLSGAVNGAVAENRERNAEKRALCLENKMKEMEQLRGNDLAFRARAEALLDTVEQEAAASGISPSRAIQEILAKAPSAQGSLADKVIADREAMTNRDTALA